MRAVRAVARRVSGPPVVRVHVEWIRLPRRRTVNPDWFVFLRLPLQELPEGKSFANANGRSFRGAKEMATKKKTAKKTRSPKKAAKRVAKRSPKKSPAKKPARSHKKTARKTKSKK